MPSIEQTRDLFIKDKSVLDIQKHAIFSFNTGTEQSMLQFYCCMIELKDRLTTMAFKAFENQFNRINI